MNRVALKSASFELRTIKGEWRRGKKALFSLYALLAILHFVVVANASDNFTNSDSVITAAAETARLKSAQFWAGAALPGNWYTPCPIHVRHAQHSGGGATSFRFEGGEVFDWSMTIEGPRELLLRDVIPHEVDHMVRASLVRRPIERWLDEGCATLFESAEVHNNLRATATTVDASIVHKEWLGSLDYPDNSSDVLSLYAVGFSLVEFLLSEQSAETLLEFQHDQSSIEQRLVQHYGLTVSQLRAEWDQWRRTSSRPQAQSVLRCECTSLTKPLLVIWTAKWCGACRGLWAEWNTNATFREALQSKFHIHILDYDQHRALALKHGVQSLPTFQTQQATIVGFEGTESLLQRLLPATSEIDSVNDSSDESKITKDDEPSPQTITGEGKSGREGGGGAIPAPDSPSPILYSQFPSPPPPLTPSSQTTTPPKKTTNIIKDLIGVGASIGIPTLWGGVAAGSGGTAILGWAALQFIRRRARRKKSGGGGERETPDPFPPSSSLPISHSLNPLTPFPRELDEARQLLELRKSEGRVGILDAIRGMFLDDEIEKLKATNPETIAFTKQLLDAIDRRVDDVAPLSTSYPRP